MNDQTTGDSESPPAPAGTRRVFLALPLDEPCRASLADLSTRLTKAARFTPARIGWVPPANFHLTLHFLGAVAAAQVDRLVADLPAAVGGVLSFDLRLRGVGYFPHAKAPRVFWAGVHRPPAELMRLHERLARLVTGTGLELQYDNFHAHVTLARFKSLTGTVAFANMASDFREKEFGSFAVNRVDLMESTLAPGGAQYTIIGSGRLADGGGTPD